MYSEGDSVLLPARIKPDNKLMFKPLKINEARLVHSGLEWRYSLEDPEHGGQFAEGHFFQEVRLMQDI
jgi:hypothetical protein